MPSPLLNGIPASALCPVDPVPVPRARGRLGEGRTRVGCCYLARVLEVPLKPSSIIRHSPEIPSYLAAIASFTAAATRATHCSSLSERTCLSPAGACNTTVYADLMRTSHATPAIINASPGIAKARALIGTLSLNLLNSIPDRPTGVASGSCVKAHRPTTNPTTRMPMAGNLGADSFRVLADVAPCNGNDNRWLVI